MNSCRKTIINLEEFLSLVIIRQKVGLLEDASWLRDGIFVGWMNTYHVGSQEDLFADFSGELVGLKLMTNKRTLVCFDGELECMSIGYIDDIFFDRIIIPAWFAARIIIIVTVHGIIVIFLFLCILSGGARRFYIRRGFGRDGCG